MSDKTETKKQRAFLDFVDEQGLTLMLPMRGDGSLHIDDQDVSWSLSGHDVQIAEALGAYDDGNYHVWSCIETQDGKDVIAGFHLGQAEFFIITKEAYCGDELRHPLFLPEAVPTIELSLLQRSAIEVALLWYSAKYAEAEPMEVLISELNKSRACSTSMKFAWGLNEIDVIDDALEQLIKELATPQSIKRLLRTASDRVNAIREKLLFM